MDPSSPPVNLSEGLHGDSSKLPHSVDKSEALFSMYLARSDVDDKDTIERWKGESDAILIFTGLFSAALAALLSVSIQGLQPSPQDTSAFYLGNIYHLLANTTTQPTASNPPIFSPPKYAVLVNALWFLSLVMSLTGALLAVFIQQWSQSYFWAIRQRNSPPNRARIRSYHKEGLDKWKLRQVTRAVPILIHVSLFLFFSGLPVFLFHVNRTVFNVVVTWLALCLAGYACITLMPIFCQDSPYFSPLSSSIWFWFINMLFIVYRLLKIFIPRNSSIFRWYHTHYAKSHPRWPSAQAMQEAAARFALQLSSDIDYRSLSWTFGTLSGDNELEEFFDALPSLCDSEALGDPQSAFIEPHEEMLSHALVGMMDRTLLSDLVPEDVKQRRIIICFKAIDATLLLGPWWTLRRVLLGDWHGFSRSIHFGLFVQGWKRISTPVTAFYAQYVVAVTLANAQVRDDNWFQLASGQLNKSKYLLWGYYASGDTILLANATFIIGRMIQTFSGSDSQHRKDITDASKKTLELICRFDVLKTLPEHQHQFCNLWNQLVDAARNDTYPHITSLCTMMLKSTRRLYMALHERTTSSPTAFSPSTDDRDDVLNDAGSFPRCEIHEHEPSLPVPKLQLGELPRNTLPTLVSSAMSPALIPFPQPPSTPHPSRSRSRRHPPFSDTFGGGPYYPPTLAPNRPPTPGPYYPVVPGSYSHSTPPAPPVPPGFSSFVPGSYPRSAPPAPPVPPGFSSFVPGSYSHSAPPVPPGFSSFVPGAYSQSAPPAALPGFSPFVPIPQTASSRTHRRRRRRGVPATMAETDSQQDYNPPRSPSASTYRSSSSASQVHRVHEPAPPTLEQPDVVSPVIHAPVSTTYIYASPGISGPTTTNRLERPSSPPTMVISETLPASPLSTPSSARGSGTAAGEPPVILSSPQGISIPSSPHSVSQEPPVSHQGTSLPVKASRDTSPTRHVVSFDIPGPSTPSAASVPLSSPGTPVAAAPSASFSRAVPIATHMARGRTMSSAVGTGGHARSTLLATGMPPVIKFNGHGDFSGLVYYSLHKVLYEDELYPTALHLYEARKFLPNWPGLADRVRQCDHVEQVTSISAELPNFVRQDWTYVALSIMDEVLYFKFRQHGSLRTLLFKTYPSELVYVEPRDPFWGDGAGVGMNELGKSLMRVRERLRREGGID